MIRTQPRRKLIARATPRSCDLIRGVSRSSSKGTYKINIKSVDGATETGEKTLVTHPGYQCGAASDPECFPDITGALASGSDRG